MNTQALIGAAIGILVVAIVLFQVAIPTYKDSVTANNFLYQVTGETFNAPSYDTPVQLAHTNIKENSEKVYNATYTAVRGTDYTMDYTAGTITILSTGNLKNATDYNIDYWYYGPLTGTEKSLADLAPMFMVLGLFVVVTAVFVLRWL